MPRRIEDYALLGDTQTAALVSRDGSIDWLCLPRFDSDACFAALLGDEEHGCWRIAPQGEVRSCRRRYAPGTLVLETEITTDEGTVRVVDFMPPREETPDLVRIVEGVRGRVAVSLALRLRFGYGRVRPWTRQLDGHVAAVAGPDSLTLHASSGIAFRQGDGAILQSDFTLGPKDRASFVLTWSPSYASAPQPVDPIRAREETLHWWAAWSAQRRYAGDWAEAVQSSLVALKGLTYLPTGGIVAAATTSLPERIGGVRNWDYRYCWLRDATFTLVALMGSGFEREALAWRDWLLRAVAGDPSQLQIMYGCAGERRLTEIELPWLPGYEGSRPVRIGNLAVEQFQLDVYGEVLDTLEQARRIGIAENAESWALQRALADFVASNWQRKDLGLWEVRGPERHFTHSKVMAWAALDRVIHGVEKFGLEGEMARWRAVREEIRRDVLAHAYDAKRNAFMQSYGSGHVDASALLMPLVGFLPATDPRMRGTVEAIERELVHGGLVRRYLNRDELEALPGEEGVFLACSFWLADNLVLLGRRDEAVALFEHLLSLRNDVGLLAEQYDPDSRRMLGNFPQAFSHVALVNTARHLSRTEDVEPDERAEADESN